MQYAYHRLARSAPKYAWWKALVAGVIGVAIFVVLSTVVAIGWLAVRIATEPSVLDDPNTLLGSVSDLDLADPLTFVLVTASVAVMLPSVLIARLIMGPRPVGLLSSIAGRLRWRWLARCTGIAVVVIGVIFGVQFLIPAAPADAGPTVAVSTTILLIVLALVLTPLQAAAEEYVFRGYLMQTIGGWLRHPAWAILLPVPIFTVLHVQYGFLALLNVAVLGLAFGYMTWRTGGLEAAIALHVVNNTLLFVLGAFRLVDNGESEGDILGLLLSIVLAGSYTALVVWQAKRVGLETTRTAHPDEPPMERWAPPAAVESDAEPASELVDVPSVPRSDPLATTTEKPSAADSAWAPPADR